MRPHLLHILSLPLSPSLLIGSRPACPLFLSLALFVSFVFLIRLLHNPNTFQVKRLFSLALVTTKKMRYWDLLGWPSFYAIIKAKEATHIIKITAELKGFLERKDLYTWVIYEPLRQFSWRQGQNWDNEFSRRLFFIISTPVKRSRLFAYEWADS